MNGKLLMIMAMGMSIMLLGCAQSGSPSASAGNGRLVLGIKDAAADMGAVSSVMVTIDSVQV